MQQAEFEEVVGKQNICDNVQEALRRAEEVFEGLEVTSLANTWLAVSDPRLVGNRGSRFLSSQVDAAGHA
jgi:hypothetical protein